MKAKVRRIGLVGLLTLLVLAVAVLLLLQSRWVAERVKQALVERADRDYHLKLTIKRLDLEALGFKATLHGVELTPKDEPESRPLLTAKSVTVRYRSINLFTRAVALEEIRVQQPTVHLAFGKERVSAWAWNEQRNTAYDLFNYSIRKLTVQDGRIELGDRTIPWSAQTERWSSTVSYEARAPKYTIRFSFAKGRVAWDDETLSDIAADMDLDWSRKGLTARSAQLHTQGIHARLSGDIPTFTPLRYQAYFDSDIDVDELKNHVHVLRDVKERAWVTGTLKLNGRLSGTGPEVAVSARMQSAALGLRGLPMRNVTADLEMDLRQARVSRFHASTLGGNIQADYTLGFAGDAGKPTAAARSVLTCTLTSVDFNAWARAMGQQNIPVSSRITGAGRLEWVGAEIAHATGAAQVTLTAARPAEPKHNPSSHDGADLQKMIPLSGQVNLSLEKGGVRLSPAALETPETKAEITGSIDRAGDSDLALRIESRNAEEVVEIMRRFGYDLSQWAPETRLAGRLQFEGTTQGRPDRPSINGRVRVERVTYKTESWQDFSAQLAHAGPRVRMTRAVIHQQAAEARFDLDLEFRHRLTVTAELSNLPVQTLKNLADRQDPVDGRISGQVHVDGPIETPTARATLTLSAGSLFSQPIDQAQIQIHYQHPQLQVLKASVRKGAATLTGSGSADLQQQRLQLKAVARAWRLEDLPALTEKSSAFFPFTGLIDTDIEVSGSFSDPVIQAQSEIKNVRVRDHALGTVSLRATGRNQALQWRAQFNGGPNRATATGSLGMAAPYPAQITIEVQKMSLPFLLALAAPPHGEIDGDMAGTIKASLSLKDPGRTLIWSARIPQVHIQAESYRIENVGDLVLKYASDEITLQQFRWRGQGTELEAGGTFKTTPDGPMNISLQGSGQLEILSTWLPELEVAGLAGVHVLATGTRTRPNLIGEATITKARLHMPDWPTPIFDADARIKFTAAQARLTEISAKTKYGPIRGEGAVFIKGFKPQQWKVDLQGTRLRVPEPEGFISLVDANLTLMGNEQAQWLSGRVLIRNSEYKKQIELADLILAHSKNANSSPAIISGTTPLHLDLDMHGEDTIRVRTNFADLVGSANLRIKGTYQSPVVLGRITISQGSLNLQDYRYQVVNGAINFSDPVRITPVIRLQAETVVKQYTVTVDLNGPLNKLTIGVRSDPPLPTVDVLNLLAAGQEPVGTAAHEVAPSAVLGEVLLKEWESRAGRVVGLDRLTIDPFAVGGIANPTTRLTLKKQIHRNLSVTYATNLTESQDNVVLIEYVLSNKVVVVGTRDERGKLGLDFKIKKRF